MASVAERGRAMREALEAAAALDAAISRCRSAGEVGAGDATARADERAN